MLTALRQQALQLVRQISEDQVPDIIQYLHSLLGNVGSPLEDEATISPKLKAFLDLEKMVKPVPELDCKKELEEARDILALFTTVFFYKFFSFSYYYFCI